MELQKMTHELKASRRKYMPKVDVKEYLSLLGLNLKVKGRNFFEYLRILYRYYRRLPFAKTDSSLTLMYLFDNPFSISRRYFLHRAHSEEYTYGETPLTTFEQIAKEARITPQDTVYELGCGRGRVCFWLHHFIGCPVVGVEMVPDFVVRAQRIQKKLGLEKIEFRNEDFLNTDLSKATVIYLYGTCLEEETIKKLIKHFKKLKSGTRIITISYPLSDYTDEPLFETMKRFPARFTWGEGDVYIQVKKS
jgi:SAM-dependent methyltransferase